MKWIVPVALAALLLAGGGWWISNQGQSRTATAMADYAVPGAAMAQSSEAAEVVEMAQGSPDAPVEVIEYASFTCPHCATFHIGGTYEQLKENYIDTGKIRYVYREVYFDKYGMWASMIARCAGPERFFGVVDLIYEGQSTWTRAGSDAAIADELRRIGRLAGMENEQLEACLTDSAHLRALVEWYQQNAETHGIRATPSFVIDGETYSNMSYAEFAEIIDERLGE
jgi:protein-disulfide isomerase